MQIKSITVGVGASVSRPNRNIRTHVILTADILRDECEIQSARILQDHAKTLVNDHINKMLMENEAGKKQTKRTK